MADNIPSDNNNNMADNNGDGTTDTESENGNSNPTNLQQQIDHLDVELRASRQRIHGLEQLIQR